MNHDHRRRWIYVCLTLLSGLILGAACVVSERKVRRTAQPQPRSAMDVSAEPATTRATRGSTVAPRAPAPRDAIVVGSSSIKSTLGRVIADDLERWGFRVTRRGIVSAGLARPDFRDMREVVDELPIGEGTAAVFVYMGMNDGQSIWLRPSERREQEEPWLRWHDPRWDEVYTRRAHNLFRSICERGAQRAIVMLPIEVAKPRLERKMRRIRRLQRRAARGVRCAQAVSTEGDRGRFVLNGQPLRTRDGFHLSARGARLVWMRVQQRAPQLAELARSSGLSAN